MTVRRAHLIGWCKQWPVAWATGSHAILTYLHAIFSLDLDSLDLDSVDLDSVDLDSVDLDWAALV